MWVGMSGHGVCGVVWLIGVVCILLYAFVCAYVGGGGCKWVWRV